MGTSLVVHPFASLVDRVPDNCVRILVNMEPAGDIGELDNDVVLLGKCDDIVQQLAAELGWDEELKAAWAATADSVSVEAEVPDQESSIPKDAATQEHLEDEVNKLADAVGASLTTNDATEDHAAEPVSHSENYPPAEQENLALAEAPTVADPDIDAHAPSTDDDKPSASGTKVHLQPSIRDV